MVDQFLERFFRRYDAEIVQHFMPEAGIEQMEHGMFRAADIQIDRQPFFLQLFGAELLDRYADR